MDVLIALGTSAAFIYSILVSVYPSFLPLPAQHVYFEAAIMILDFVNLGQLLELRARGKTLAAIDRLLALQVSQATLVVDDIDKTVGVGELQLNDIVRVKPGEKIPIDGVIIHGQSAIDQTAHCQACR
jgi:Cu+-exporting ATPase